MQYYSNTLEFANSLPSVITLGKFDGLHRGHELLINKIMEIKTSFSEINIVFTFDIPPKTILVGEKNEVITTNYEKKRIFENLQIDFLIECPFTDSVRNMEPEKFISWITKALSIRHIVVGTDFCFGRNRAGNTEVLRAFESRYGYETIVVEKLCENGREISSTFVRECLKNGDLSHANRLLGYPYFVCGTVSHGSGIGHTIGVPTINLNPPPDKLLPVFGVYLCDVRIDRICYRGVGNVGVKPTISGSRNPGIEVFLFDFSGDLYGKEVRVDFLSFLRPEMRFDSTEALRIQLLRDIETAKKCDLLHKYYKKFEKK